MNYCSESQSGGLTSESNQEYQYQLSSDPASHPNESESDDSRFDEDSSLSWNEDGAAITAANTNHSDRTSLSSESSGISSSRDSQFESQGGGERLAPSQS